MSQHKNRADDIDLRGILHCPAGNQGPSTLVLLAGEDPLLAVALAPRFTRVMHVLIDGLQVDVSLGIPMAHRGYRVRRYVADQVAALTKWPLQPDAVGKYIGHIIRATHKAMAEAEGEALEKVGVIQRGGRRGSRVNPEIKWEILDLGGGQPKPPAA
jgi:hypothetical protein